jgi:hypothetical protein
MSNVRTFGWHATIVGGGPCDCGRADCGDSDGPPFAYTVGLGHAKDHPDLLITGQKRELMHAALSAAVQGVLKGRRLERGDLLENVIGRYPVLVEEVSDEGLDETVLSSHWFHRRRMPALQLLWPDTQGIWGWQPGAAPYAEELQPQRWRQPVERTGPVAVDPDWVMPMPADRLVNACSCIVDEGAPVRVVLRQAGEQWLFLCGEQHPDLRAVLTLSHASHVIRSAPSVLGLRDLPLSTEAERADVWSPWVLRPVA